jgi:hypothetical protein
MKRGSFSFGQRNARRGGRGGGKILVISHFPAQIKREQVNNDEEEHYAIKKFRPESWRYDAIPETTRAESTPC